MALINVVALYEEYVAALSRAFGGTAFAQDLQFPSKGVAGTTRRGVRNALADMTNSKSPAMLSGFTHMLRAQRSYRGKELDHLLLIYRYFKEMRNALLHEGGIATRRLRKAYEGMGGVSRSSVRMKELPRHVEPVEGEPTALPLRGVIGFGGVVFYMATTIDAELSQTPVAEKEFLDRFRSRHQIRDLPSTEPRRSGRVRSLVEGLELPRPDTAKGIESLLVAEGLVR